VLPFDLHVLGMPPAFNLSQDQTLQLFFLLNFYFYSFGASRGKAPNQFVFYIFNELASLA
jgi:hypothetical protein